MLSGFLCLKVPGVRNVGLDSFTHILRGAGSLLIIIRTRVPVKGPPWLSDPVIRRTMAWRSLGRHLHFAATHLCEGIVMLPTQLRVQTENTPQINQTSVLVVVSASPHESE